MAVAAALFNVSKAKGVIAAAVPLDAMVRVRLYKPKRICSAVVAMTPQSVILCTITRFVALPTILHTTPSVPDVVAVGAVDAMYVLKSAPRI